MKDTAIRKIFGATGPARLTPQNAGGGEITNDAFLHKTRPTHFDFEQQLFLYLDGIGAPTAKVPIIVKQRLLRMWDQMLDAEWDNLLARYDDAHDAFGELFFSRPDVIQLISVPNQDQDAAWVMVLDTAFEHLDLPDRDKYDNFLRPRLSAILQKAKAAFQQPIPANVGYEDRIFGTAVDITQNIMLKELFDHGFNPKPLMWQDWVPYNG